MVIKILGEVCKNCEILAANTKEVVKTLGFEAHFEKVKDFKQIAAYGVMSTPAFVVDEKAVPYRMVLKPKDIVKIHGKEASHHG